jgi:transcriptional regulator with XRE-family HTH domain
MALGNMTQKELADLAGVARTSIQAIELCKLKLSPGLAHKISCATGVNYSWLMDGDASIPPINHAGRPYMESDFALAQGRLYTEADLPYTTEDFKPTALIGDLKEPQKRLSTYHSHMGRLQLAQAYYLLRRILGDAKKESRDFEFQAGHFLYRLEHFVRTELRKRPQLAEQIFAEQEQQWQQMEARVAPGRVYPKGGFLTPADTKACDVMEQDSAQNRATIQRFQKDLFGKPGVAKKAPKRSSSSSLHQAA